MIHPQTMADAAKAAWSKASAEFNANPTMEAQKTAETLYHVMSNSRARKLLREALNNG